MTNNEKIKELFLTTRLSNERFAQYLSVKPAYVSNIYSNRVNVSDSKFTEYFKNFQLNYIVNEILSKVYSELSDLKLDSGDRVNELNIKVNINKYGIKETLQIDIHDVYRVPFNQYTAEGNIIGERVKEEPYDYEIGYYDSDFEEITQKLNKNGTRI